MCTESAYSMLAFVKEIKEFISLSYLTFPKIIATQVSPSLLAGFRCHRKSRSIVRDYKGLNNHPSKRFHQKIS